MHAYAAQRLNPFKTLIREVKMRLNVNTRDPSPPPKPYNARKHQQPEYNSEGNKRRYRHLLIKAAVKDICDHCSEKLVTIIVHKRNLNCSSRGDICLDQR